MTITAHPQTLQPNFPGCPSWCDQKDAHDPHGEVGDAYGVGTLAPRLHETELARIGSAALTYGHDVNISIAVFREDHGSYNGATEQGVPTAEIGVYEHHGHSVIYRPTADQLRTAAAAFAAAADLLDPTP